MFVSESSVNSIVLLIVGVISTIFSHNTIRRTEPSITTDTTISIGRVPSRPKRIDQTINDTFFISRIIQPDRYAAVYIEKNRRSNYYQRLCNFAVEDSDQLDYLKERYSPVVTHLHLPDVPTDWLPLISYKNNWYLYAPSDWGNTGRIMISDSAMIYWMLEGPTLAPLVEITETDPKTYSIIHKDMESDKATNTRIIIHLIDRSKGLAVWEYRVNGEPSRYGLYVTKEHAIDFDMIANDSNNKEFEFEADEIDAKKLLQ